MAAACYFVFSSLFQLLLSAFFLAALRACIKVALERVATLDMHAATADSWWSANAGGVTWALRMATVARLWWAATAAAGSASWWKATRGGGTRQRTRAKRGVAARRFTRWCEMRVITIVFARAGRIIRLALLQYCLQTAGRAATSCTRVPSARCCKPRKQIQIFDSTRTANGERQPQPQ